MLSQLTERRREYAAFFGTYGWRWWMTFTFARSHSLTEGNRRLEHCFRTLEERHRDQFSCLICPESAWYSGCGKPGGRLHFHVLLGCARNYDADVFTKLWHREEFGGRYVKGAGLDVEPYDSSLGAVFYMTKFMRDPSWDYSLRNPELISAGGKEHFSYLQFTPTAPSLQRAT